jgi:negative regulator of replication initiation
MSQIHVDHSSVVNLANQMDELSHRAQDVMSRYQEAAQHAQASQVFDSGAGDTNVVTAAEIHDAQMKIQTRFQAVNDLLRSGASTFTNSDEQNAHQIASVGSSLRYT